MSELMFPSTSAITPEGRCVGCDLELPIADDGPWRGRRMPHIQLQCIYVLNYRLARLEERIRALEKGETPH